MCVRVLEGTRFALAATCSFIVHISDLPYIEGKERQRSISGCAFVLDRVSLFVYQSIVCLNPSSKGTRARNPNNFSALVTSRQRRGWPSGFDLSQTMRPRNPVSCAMSD